MTGYDLAIVGGGIVGAACALEATLAGLKVALIEAAIVGGGATAAGMGHIVVMDDSEPQFALTQYSQQLWQQMSVHLPAEAEYMTCGTIWVAADDQEMAEVRRKADYYTQRGVLVDILDAHSLADAEPNLRGGLAGGLLVSADGVVYPPVVARWLLEQAKTRGATCYVGLAALSISDHAVTLIDGTIIQAAATVNAMGVWSPSLTPGLSVQKRKGHLVITDRYPDHVRHQLVELGYLTSAHGSSADSVAFNVQPRHTGQILIGSSRQYGVESANDDAVMVERMLSRAFHYMPSLAALSALRVWTGFRAATPDKLPLIGLAAGHDGLYLATGHEGLGITTCLGTAKLLIDQLLNRAPEIPVEPYLPTRMLHG